MVQTVGIVFPGQGSQSVGMLGDIASEYREVIDVYQKASDVLGYDLWALVQNGPDELIDQTVHTQPALLAGSYAIWKILQKHKATEPALLAGHSLGEYTALVCAGALDFQDAIALVAARGHYMQEAVPAGQGALAAIVGLEDAAVSALCAQAVQAHEVLAPANFNSPGQVVIAGHTLAVQRAIILAKEAGAKLAKLLPVSVPSHCSLMQSAAQKLQIALDKITIKSPNIPVINNVDVLPYQNPDQIRSGLTRQLYSPVRWVETMTAFQQAGITEIIECGPGKTLTGLNKRIVPGLQHVMTGDLKGLQSLFSNSLPIN